jgi:Ser/Thr protein kinase RdoA (MazF antagonist)
MHNTSQTALDALARSAALDFAVYGDFESIAPFGGGLINHTFVSVWNQAGTRVRYLHQRINDRVFTRPDHVMENFTRVTAHIAAKTAGMPNHSRRTLTVVRTRDGLPYTRDAEGGWWRTYLFVEGVRAQDLASSPEEARVLGAGIGRFQKQLADLPPPRLHETIPNFHNMETRYARFHAALSGDPLKRACEAQEEIAFMEANEERGMILIRGLRDGTLPERICHNDTKMNNIFLDQATGEALCVADLDTVMPGTALFDAGDLIRTVCSRTGEEERDLTKVAFDPHFFEALIAGYRSEADAFLTAEEKRLIPEAGRNLTHIMALRFLTDYLEGDHYYATSRPKHNLDRCRNQLALIRSLDASMYG